MKSQFGTCNHSMPGLRSGMVPHNHMPTWDWIWKYLNNLVYIKNDWMVGSREWNFRLYNQEMNKKTRRWKIWNFVKIRYTTWLNRKMGKVWGRRYSWQIFLWDLDLITNLEPKAQNIITSPYSPTHFARGWRPRYIYLQDVNINDKRNIFNVSIERLKMAYLDG